MKTITKTVLSAVLIPLLLTGCIDEFHTETVPSSPDYIGFSSTTTRAAIAGLDALKNDGNGFKVFATAGSTPAGWYVDDSYSRIDGTNNYCYNNSTGKWNFNQAVKWPSVSADYPLKFYAIHPASPAGLTISHNFTPSGLTGFTASYTIQNAGNQADLLAAASLAASKPSSGNLPLVFNHILSKIDFGIIAGKHTEPYIQAIQIVNAGDTRTFDFIAGDWASSPAVSGKATYYYNGAPAGNSVITAFRPGIKDEVTANPVHAGVHAGHLMLMPQTASSWTPGSAFTTGAYISVIYRMETGVGSNGTGTPNEAGFADATAHPDYAALGGGVTGPLFVKVAFPLAQGNFTWNKGYGYTYNISLGTPNSCNGYILDDTYYDRTGAKTNLPLTEISREGKKVGDKLQNGIIQVALKIDEWNDRDGTVDIGSIRVTPSSLLLGSAAQTPAPQSLHVQCTRSDGVTPDPNANWTLSVPFAASAWLKLSLNPAASFDAPDAGITVSGTGTGYVYLYVKENATLSLRSTDFFLDNVKAGVINQTFNFETIPGINGPTAFLSYVGAFWRADQTGERVIRVNPGNAGIGVWTATVVWMDQRWGEGDGVVLSVDRLPGTPGADPAIYTASPGDAEDYPVKEDNMTISGNVSSGQNITFRIGLKSNYTPTPGYPVRYAVVVLSYNNNSKHYKIYLRQGEGADYLMRNSEPGTVMASRPNAARLSPYNLTAPAGTLATYENLNWNNGNNPVQGSFTEFPSQAGAIFQWVHSTTGRYAWSPFGSGLSTYWNVSGNYNGPWSGHRNQYETCPANYRRPTDGSIGNDYQTTGSYTTSEIRQSLWLNPQNVSGAFNSNTANSVFGYYADGFFDRRPIVASPVNYTGSSAVSITDRNIACIGNLFFNPATNASLFFPRAGYRQGTGGALQENGAEGYYWTGSSFSTGEAWYLCIGHSGRNFSGDVLAYMHHDSFGKNYGQSIRCVYAP
jgi:hypothetical protein